MNPFLATSPALNGFSHLFHKSEFVKVDPQQCVPLTNIRQLTKFGVDYLVANFNPAPIFSGLPIVVQLSGHHLNFAVDYFIKSENLEKSQAEARVKSKHTWYGIVDGDHRRKALCILAKKQPDLYRGYGWAVIKIQMAPLATLKVLARAMNSTQRKPRYPDYSISDVLSKLKTIAVSISSDRGIALNSKEDTPRGLIAEVAGCYCRDADLSLGTLRGLVGSAIKLSFPVIEEMDKILNNANHRSSYDYRKIITTATLKGATTFLNTDQDADKINTLHRLRYLASDSCNKGTTKCKGIPKSVLEKQVKRAIAARLEVEKFQDMLGSDVWPHQMKILRANTLRTTKLDDQVERNEGNGRVLLPEFKRSYVELYKQNGLHRVQAWSRAIAQSNLERTARTETDESLEPAIGPTAISKQRLQRLASTYVQEGGEMPRKKTRVMTKAVRG